MENQQGNFGPILPIADTVSGTQARENPQGTIDHYQSLQTQLWLSPKVRDVADGMLSHVQQGRTAWGSLSGPYGFGKTAAAISLWTHARNEGFLAIPPLSCTNFDELAYGIVALAELQAPKMKRQIQTCFREVWTEGLDHVVQADAKRYAVSARKVRQIFQDKLRSGQFTLDSHPYRLVEFLAKLGHLTTSFSNGLVIILDEIQQLLGPLDARAIVRFREFVWGMRTERSHCGVILALDSLLEARLARWAADVLHRIRENGPTLQLADVYTREFPFWLWERLTNTYEKDKRRLPQAALTQEVLLSLGQLVERPDLTDGPRTVIEVFSRAAVHHQKIGKSYDIPELIEDVHQGRFRYFGEGATIQSVLTQVLSDEWVLRDKGRQLLVRTLAAFPFGCPQKTLQRYLPGEEQLERAKEELFGPLLVELKDGLALELLQQVRRTRSNWERILWRCWETLPALDVLATHVPDMVQRILIPRLFPKGNPAAPMWEQLSNDFSTVLKGWHILRGTFDDAYPQREIALCVTDKEPDSWPPDVDICIALVCNASIEIDVNPRAELRDIDSVICIVLTLPVLRPLTDGLPADLQRYHKYIQPEPFRPATILTALHELEALLGNLTDNGSDAGEFHPPEDDSEVHRVKAFVKMSVDFVLRELLRGTVDVGSGRPIQLRGPELLRALFSQGCRRRFPQYQTLVKTAKWQEILSTYRMGVRWNGLNAAQRQGRDHTTLPKGEMYDTLFDQASTAAGDSFIRKLGPLAQTEGNAESFSLRLTMHPAEVALLDYLKGLKGHQPIPFDAAAEYLRHQGYIQAEAEEVIKLLVDRELLTNDKNGDLQVIRNAEIEHERLQEKIVGVRYQLHRLRADDGLEMPSRAASIAGLQNHLHFLEARLSVCVGKQIKELENGLHSLYERIGTVQAATIQTDWSDSDLSTHLTSPDYS